MDEAWKKNALNASVLYRFFWEAEAGWQGIHNRLAALLPYSSKSPRKTLRGIGTSFAINLSEIGVGVKYRCYTHGSYAEMGMVDPVNHKLRR